jgi:hypothetical integral membrane protein (TIGR02206 family)
MIFSSTHITILGAIIATTAILVRSARHSKATAHRIRLGCGLFVLVNELIWLSYVVWNGWLSFPDYLPLHLSNLIVAVTVFAAFTLRPLLVEFAYYTGVGGGVVAVLTPDLESIELSFDVVHFFLAHGGVLVTMLYITAAGLARPGPGSVWRAFAALNAYAAVIAIFNFAFGTNYMYLREKPEVPTLFDLFGPWPVYILVAEAFALMVFSLLYLPFFKARVRKSTSIRDC